MGNKQPIPYQDVYSLKHLLEALQSSLSELRQATYDDADHGHPAIIHRMLPEALHPDERYCHPWGAGNLALRTEHQKHEQALIGIEDIWFNDQANPRRTFDYPGLIISRPSTLKIVNTVNNAKDDFKEGVLALKAKYRDLTDSDIEEELRMREGEWASLETVKQAFNKAGLARICIKQVYRKIPTIQTLGLLRAKYYHNPKRPSRPRTVAEQLEKFHMKVKKGAQTQDIIDAIKVLKEMDPNQPISERQDSNEVITVNFKTPDHSTDSGAKWRQVTGVLPIYCVGNPALDLEKLVDFTSLDKPYEERNSNKKCPRKAQVSWSEQPFLPAFRLYLPAKPDTTH
jgi:hypothetical protein